MKLSLTLYLAGLLAVSFQGTTKSAEVGDEVCSEGFIMDQFCINRERMWDNGRKTLEEPELHTFHCLLDVPECYTSHFNILVPNGDGTYRISYRVDDDGRQQLIDLGRETGKKGSYPACSECKSSDGPIQGFRAEVRGFLMYKGDGTNDDPDLISVTGLMATTELDGEFCASTEESTPEPTAAPTAAPTKEPTVAPTAAPTKERTASGPTNPTAAPVVATESPTTEAPTAVRSVELQGEVLIRLLSAPGEISGSAVDTYNSACTDFFGTNLPEVVANIDCQLTVQNFLSRRLRVLNENSTALDTIALVTGGGAYDPDSFVDLLGTTLNQNANEFVDMLKTGGDAESQNFYSSITAAEAYDPEGVQTESPTIAPTKAPVVSPTSSPTLSPVVNTTDTRSGARSASYVSAVIVAAVLAWVL